MYRIFPKTGGKLNNKEDNIHKQQSQKKPGIERYSEDVQMSKK